MERTYKKIEILCVSDTSFGEATQNAVVKAASHCWNSGAGETGNNRGPQVAETKLRHR